MTKSFKKVPAPTASVVNAWTPNSKGWVNIDTRVFTSEDGMRALLLAREAQAKEQEAKQLLAAIAFKATGKVWSVSLTSAFWNKNPSIGFALKEADTAKANKPDFTL